MTGPPTPGEAERTTETVEGVVDSSATNRSRLGSVIGDHIEAEEVRVYSDDQAFSFNVELDGNDLFASEQSPSSGDESFEPGQNVRVGGAGGATLHADVSSAGTDATVYVAVQVSYLSG